MRRLKPQPNIKPFKVFDDDVTLTEEMDLNGMPPTSEFFITIPPVPSVNHSYFNCHGRRAMTSQGKDYKTNLGSLAIYERQKQGWPIVVGKKVVMELRVFWKDRRRRDTDNIIKIIQDSFSGILYDDDRWVLPRIMDWDLDPTHPRVEIKIYKLNRGGN